MQTSRQIRLPFGVRLAVEVFLISSCRSGVTELGNLGTRQSLAGWETIHRCKGCLFRGGLCALSLSTTSSLFIDAKV